MGVVEIQTMMACSSSIWLQDAALQLNVANTALCLGLYNNRSIDIHATIIIALWGKLNFLCMYYSLQGSLMLQFFIYVILYQTFFSLIASTQNARSCTWKTARSDIWWVRRWIAWGLLWWFWLASFFNMAFSTK